VIPTFSQVTSVTPIQPHQKVLERRGADADVASIVRSESSANHTTLKDVPADYILGVDDQISLWTPEAEELDSKVLRITGNG